MDSSRPVYVKGNISFKADDKIFKFDSVNISAFGVVGLPWGTLRSFIHFGLEVKVKVQILGQRAIEFETPATLVREKSTTGDLMGVKFALSDKQKEEMERQVDAGGFTPKDYERKYPRTPFSKLSGAFPLKALVTEVHANPEEGGALDSIPLVFDVVNLSPGGILLAIKSRNNERVKKIAPQHKIKMILESKGWFPKSIVMEGLVCRVTDEKGAEVDSLNRYIGVKFIKVEVQNFVTLMELIRAISDLVNGKQAPAS